MAELKTSDLIQQTLVFAARQLQRSEVRLGTIERLVRACDAIENGKALEAIKSDLGKKHISGEANFKITPSNIEKYVKAKKWSGPKRAVISSDGDLKAYVKAREEERLKPILPKRASSKRLEIEAAIDQVSDVGQRTMVRHELAAGQKARNELNLLTRALKNIPGLDYNALMGGAKPIEKDKRELTEIASLNLEDGQTLETLIERLDDIQELSRMGLEQVNGRIKVKATHADVINKRELALLRRLLRTQKEPPR